MHKPAPKARSRLPSLDLLKGFESAARHLSFTKAAEELFLTQSALSRQMQTLEEQLGLPLFERRHRQLLLTDAGQVLHATAKSVLDEIALAVSAIRREQASQPLTVSTNQPFASLWLIPRLARFRERHRSVDVYISADNRIVDLERERIDLAVRYCGEGNLPAGSIRLFGERIMPVCSPALAAERTRPLRRPEDLAQHVLLAIDDERGRFPWLNWSAWLAAIGIERLTPAGSLKFNHFDQVIQAAIDGQGVALGREPLIDRLLRERKLVAPFPDRYATPRAYYIVRAPHAALRPEAQAFSDWLQEEARADAVESALDSPARTPVERAPSRARARSRGSAHSK